MQKNLTTHLFIIALIRGLFTVFIDTSATAVFLETHSEESFALVYMISAAITAAAGWLLYLFLRYTRPTYTILTLSTVPALITGGIIIYLLTAGISSRAALVYMGFKDINYTLTSTAFWLSAAYLYDIRASKKVFTRFYAGEIAGFTLGGALIRFTGSEDPLSLFMLLILPLLTAATLLLNVNVFRNEKNFLILTGAEIKGTAENRGFSMNLFAYALISISAFYLLDYIFLGTLDNRLSGGVEMTAFLGGFYSLLGGFNGLMLLFFSGAIISSGRLRNMLLVTPLLITAVAGLTLAGSYTSVFTVIIAVKLLDEFLRQSFDLPIQKILLQPFDETRKFRIQTLKESAFEPAGIAITASLIFIFQPDPVTAFGTLTLSGVLWALTGRRLSDTYLKLFRKEEQNTSRDESLNYDEQAVRRYISESLFNAGHNEKRAYLKSTLLLLERHRLTGFTGALIEIISDKSLELPDRVQATLTLSYQADLRPESLKQLLKKFRKPAELSDALHRAYGRTAGGRAFNNFYAQLKNKRKKLYAAAGRVSSDSAKGRREICSEYSEATALRRAQLLEAATEICVDRPAQTFIEKGLLSGNRRLKKAALRHAAVFRSTVITEILIQMMADINYSYRSILILKDRFTEACHIINSDKHRHLFENHTFRKSFINLAGLSREEESLTAISTFLNSTDTSVRTAAARALKAVKSFNPGDFSEVDKLISEEKNIMQYFSRMLKSAAATEPPVIIQAVSGELKQSAERMLIYTAVKYHRYSDFSEIHTYFNGSPVRRAMLFEKFETVWNRNDGSEILPLLEDKDHPGECQKSFKESVNELLTGTPYRPGAWLHCALLHHEAAARNFEPEHYLLGLLHEHAAVRESAERACRRARVNVPVKTSELTGRALSTPRRKKQKRSPQMLIFEKATTLKAVDFFNETDDEILLTIAEKLHVVHVKKNEEIIRAGDMGRSMFIVHSGRLQVEKEGKVIAGVSPAEAVGELSAIDPEPRSASVKAVEKSILLRLGDDDLYSLIETNPQAANGMLKVLTRRLRSKNY